MARHEGALLRYVARVLGGDYDAAQDVVQDTFIRFLRKFRHEFRDEVWVSNWLYRVAHNRAIDHVRAKKRRTDLHERHAERSEVTTPPDRGTGFRVSDEAAKAAAMLEMIDVRERQLVILKIYEEKSYREISDITGLSAGNVGYILHHAMKKLAAALNQGTEDGNKT